MKKIIATLGVAALLLGTSNVNADTLVIPVNTAWSSTTTISIDFDFPADVVSIESISIDISHTFQSDLSFDVTGPGGAYDLLTSQTGMSGGGADLGVNGTGTPGDEATYTFVESGGILQGTGFGLGGATVNALGWGAGGDGDGWNVTIVDDFAGDGGSVSNVTIEFTSAAIPEPTSALALLGLGSVVALRRRR